MTHRDNAAGQDDPLEPEEMGLEPEEIVQAARAKLERWERLEELRERHVLPGSEPGEEPAPEQVGKISLKAVSDAYRQAAAEMARQHGYLMGGYEIPYEPGVEYWIYESD